MRPTRIRDIVMNLRKIFAQFFVAVIMGVFAIMPANAESTVYIFMRSSNCFGDGGYVNLTINGIDTCSMRGPLKKTMGNVANPSLPLFMYKPAKRKFILPEDGKYLFAVDWQFVTGQGRVSNLTAEIQLNLTEGSVHYVEIKAKGLNDLEFKELTEKEGLKALKDKKYVELPEHTYIVKE